MVHWGPEATMIRVGPPITTVPTWILIFQLLANPIFQKVEWRRDFFQNWRSYSSTRYLRKYLPPVKCAWTTVKTKKKSKATRELRVTTQTTFNNTNLSSLSPWKIQEHGLREVIVLILWPVEKTETRNKDVIKKSLNLTIVCEYCV